MDDINWLFTLAIEFLSKLGCLQEKPIPYYFCSSVFIECFDRLPSTVSLANLVGFGDFNELKVSNLFLARAGL
jgi:hypothetical protein